MKKLFLALIACVCAVGMASAQKFALVDMEYVLRNVPAYEMANEQLNQVSQRWEKEVTELAKEAETMYKNYQSDMVFLTDEQKKKREEEIVKKEANFVPVKLERNVGTVKNAVPLFVKRNRQGAGVKTARSVNIGSRASPPK